MSPSIRHRVRKRRRENQSTDEGRDGHPHMSRASAQDRENPGCVLAQRRSALPCASERREARDQGQRGMPRNISAALKRVIWLAAHSNTIELVRAGSN